MKLISLNIEGDRHYERIKPFLTKEDADVLCLMEVPYEFCDYLETQKYHVTFAPMMLKSQDPFTVYVKGIVFASKTMYETEQYYYHPPAKAAIPKTLPRYSQISGHPVIFASNDTFNIATTHFPWNPNARESHEPQAKALPIMKQYLATKLPHLLCGDLNIPRHESPYASNLMEGYTDVIPPKYGSSLDSSLHHHSDKPELAHLFSAFMVDHLLIQPPYQAHDVRLQFGLSDHAAIVAEITCS